MSKMGIFQQSSRKIVVDNYIEYCYIHYRYSWALDEPKSP